MVEHLTLNQVVEGSSPSRRTITTARVERRGPFRLGNTAQRLGPGRNSDSVNRTSVPTLDILELYQGPRARRAPIGDAMKRLLAIYLMLALCTTAARAVERIEIFADEAGTACHMEDTDGLRTLYVFLNGTPGATAAVFRAPKPECWTGATWISDNFIGGKFGDSQRGMELTFGECRQGSIYLGSIVYATTGDASECCVHGVYPNPFGTWSTVQAHYVDCGLVTAHPVQTANLVINSTPACSDCLAPPPPPPPIEPPPPPPPPPPPTGEFAIDLYMDTAMQSCELYEASGVLPRVVDIHIFHTGTSDATASEFAAPKPACWTGASYIGETIQTQFLTIGNTQADLQIAYTKCLTPPIYLGRITYLIVSSSTPACCVYRAQPAPQYQNPVAVTCGIQLFHGVAGPGVIINPDGTCSCSKALPVREATWGRIKAMYHN